MKLKLILKTKLMPLMMSKTARNTYLIFSGNSLAMVLAFFYTVILVRILSTSDFGYFSALFSFLLLFTDVTDIGIGSSLSRFLPPLKKNPQRMLGFLKSAFIAQVTIVMAVVVIIIVSAPTISVLLFHGFEKTTFVRVIGLGVAGAVMANFFSYALSAGEKFTLTAVLTTFIGITRLAFLLPLVFLSLVSLNSVVWAQIASFNISAVFGFLLLKTKFLFTKRIKGDLKILLGFASFLGIARTLTAISGRLDVLMLMALTNSIETGIYSTASRVVSLYPLLTSSFLTVIGPRISTIKDREELKDYIFKIVFGTMGLISTIVIFILIARPFMLILFGIKSMASVSVLKLLLLSMIFFTASIPGVALAIYYLKKPFILTVNSVLQLIIVIVGNLIFIPLYGRIGATFSLIAAYALSFFLTTFMSFYYLGKEKRVKTKIKFDTITPSEAI